MEFFAPNLNPLDIEHILIRILGGLEAADLRTCREVSSTWNRYTVAALRRRGQLMTLGNENIYQYMQILTARPDKTQELHVLDIHLTISVPPDSCTKIYKMIDDSLKIQELIGRPCFMSFEYGHDESDDDDSHRKRREQTKQDSSANQEVGVWKFIQLISPTLQLIHFHGQLCYSHQMNLELQSCMPHFSFPQLHTTRYDFFRMKMYEEYRGPLGPFSLVFLQIIHCAPVLKKLTLMMASLSDLKVNYDNQNTINGILSRIKQDSLNRISCLKIAVINEDTLNSLIRFQFPQLKELEVLQSINCLAMQNFLCLLNHNCPQLTALKLDISLLYRNLVEQIPRRPLVTLPMSNIIRFSCCLRYENMARFLGQVVHFNLTAAAQMFPAIEFIETDLYALGALNSVSLRPRPLFPNTKRLVVLEDMGDDNEVLENELHPLINEMCPNLVELEHQSSNNYFSYYFK